VWLVRFLGVLGAVTIFAGTVATASGPHAGGDDGQLIHRLNFRGAETLVWVIHRHATLAAALGCLVILAWFLARRRGENPALVEALTVAGVLMAAQGLLGSVQYSLELPADLVWGHVMLATFTWIALLWCVGTAGRLAPRGTPPPEIPADRPDERASFEALARR
jgi:cytochrome c oxidase assembly protein subunit 15